MSNIVFTNGVLDILTPAHINLLLLCRKWAGPEGQVIVGIDSDEKVRQDKGPNRPIFSIQERQQALLALKNGLDPIVDAVYGFESNKQLHELISFIKPSIIIKGSDWKGNVIGSDIADRVIYFDLDPRFSTSKTIEKVLTKNLYKLTSSSTPPSGIKPICTCSMKFEDGEWWHTTEACAGKKRL